MNNISFLIVVLIVVLCSCDSDLPYKEKMEQIKQVGNVDPTQALRMLDSLKHDVRTASDYVQMRYDLLEIRLKDKAYIPATSDMDIKPIVRYFKEHGNEEDQCEAYYYAGCVYRDLQDTPRSLDFFLEAQAIAEKARECDTAMLRNTYSNLHFLYYNVQDYSSALAMARKEYALSERMHDLAASDAIHVGATLVQLDSVRSAEKYLVKAFELMKDGDEETATALLCQFSNLGKKDMAMACYNKLKKLPASPWACISMGNYYNLLGANDSALYFYRKALADDSPLEAKYDAARSVFYLDKTIDHAMSFIRISDSLNFGERQQRAATINNLHQYHWDKNREQDMRREKESYRSAMLVVVLCLALTVISGVSWYFHKRYRFMRARLLQNERLDKLRKNLNELHEKERETKEALSKSQTEYSQSQEKLESVNRQLIETKENLEAKQKELEERIEQTSGIMRLLHRSELTTTAEDVVNSVRAASEGKYSMKPTDWIRFYQAVDDLYPAFGQGLVKKLKKFSEQQKQVCYLLRIGLTNTQIENITDLSHATVWRWVKKYSEVVS